MRTFREFIENLNHKNFADVLEKFIPFVQAELNVEDLPPIQIATQNESRSNKSFGWWDGERITVNPHGRHPMDALRTLAHECVHAVKGHTDGSDGSDDENEANALAGVIMRKFGRANPDLF